MQHRVWNPPKKNGKLVRNKYYMLSLLRSAWQHKSEQNVGEGEKVLGSFSCWLLRGRSERGVRQQSSGRGWRLPESNSPPICA